MSFLGRMNYISWFIAQTAVICEPIFKLLKKDAATKWTEECQKAFDRIKEYLSNPPVLVPLEPKKPLLLYLSVMDNAFGCVLGQHEETGRKEQAIYYLSKKFTPYKARYTLLERTCCAMTWIAQKFRHYLSAYTTYLISRMDPLKYIFQNQCLQDYRPATIYFPDEEVLFVGEDISESYDGWRMFFDGASNSIGVGIGAVLISKTDQYYPISAKIRFYCTNNMAEYEAYNAANLNNDLMKETCERFKIAHRNSTVYRPHMNGAVEAANKNIKKILRKIVDSHKQLHEKLPYALLGYRTTIRTSTGETPYMLVYGSEVVIPVEVEIPSLRIIQEVGLDDAEWIRSRHEQLKLINEKMMDAVGHDQLYQNRMTKAFNKKVKPRRFTPGQLVLKKIFPHQGEAKGKFAPNCQGPYMIHRVLSVER
ncbi:uncharacterized protein [Solanum tuberosum]|uniref:uncharacterized protein n=1 Tax=Solanum tuberosum TaxID=4113 RepID=UPI00073A5135|nr:PREDICTED: uncharacterized protein LOC107058641 [Solanum tuberosum]